MGVFSRLLDDPASRGWLAGAGLAFPFLANPLQTKYLALLSILPLAVHVLKHGLVARSFLSLNAFLVAIYLGAIALLGGVIVSDSRFEGETISNVIVTLMLVAIYLSAMDRRWGGQRISQGFFLTLCLTAAIVGALGLLKYWLQMGGFTFGFLVGCGGDYPQGSAFCGDYNNYCAYMLLASIGFSWRLTASRHLGETLLLSACLSIAFAAAYYSGSRRFFLAAPFLPLMWLTVAYLRRDWKTMARYVVLAVAFASVIFAVFPAPSGSLAYNPSIDHYAHARILLAQAAHPGETPETATDVPSGPDLTPRTVGIPLLIGSASSDQKFGLQSRLERWALGLQLIEENGYWSGSGLDYHNVFSCRFANCETIDYPHSPAISFWIAFGIPGLLLSLFFYASLLRLAHRSGTNGLFSGATFAMLMLLPYSLMSGDTYLSLAMVISAGLVLSSTSLPTARMT